MTIDARNLDSLSDDELAGLAEQALERQERDRRALYDQSQRVALHSLRSVIADCLDASAAADAALADQAEAERPRG